MMRFCLIIAIDDIESMFYIVNQLFSGNEKLLNIYIYLDIINASIIADKQFLS
jgi:hypothetical protein